MVSRTILLSLGLLAACGDAPAQVPAPDGMVPAVCAVRGAQHGRILPLGDGVENRAYFLYVPSSYDCAAPTALLVDFHGTAGGPAPEEAYGTDDLIALAEEHRAIIARPRSRSRNDIYQWDINPGDLERNRTFGLNLVAALADEFPIDPERIYAAGFSSGSNIVGTFLGSSTSPFRGLAPIAGGTWAAPQLPSLADGPRVYLATGYRDYLWYYARRLGEAARQAGLPADRLIVRRTGGGHELHAWQFAELWRFFETGERPSTGNVASPWTLEQLPEASDVNAFSVDGSTLVAAGAGGHVWRRDTTWTVERSRPGVDYAGLCFSGARGLVAGGGAGARRDTAAWADTAQLPDYGMLGAPWINGVDCRTDGSILIGGYWSAAISGDGGMTWSRFQVPSGFGVVDAQIADIATAPSGATILVGNYFIGRATPGATAAVSVHSPTGWVTGVSAVDGGRFWAVGDHGAIYASADDGVTWQSQNSGTSEDLYAVHFADALHGAAVGRSGTVVVTADGGQTWMPRPLGLTGYLGAVYVDATTIWVGGEDGVVAKSPR